MLPYYEEYFRQKQPNNPATDFAVNTIFPAVPQCFAIALSSWTPVPAFPALQPQTEVVLKYVNFN